MQMQIKHKCKLKTKGTLSASITFLIGKFWPATVSSDTLHHVKDIRHFLPTLLTLRTKAEPVTLLSPMQQLTWCHRHLGWDLKPRSFSFYRYNSWSIIRGMQGSVSSYRLSAQTKQFKASNMTPFSSFKARIWAHWMYTMYIDLFTFSGKYWVLLPSLHPSVWATATIKTKQAPHTKQQKRVNIKNIIPIPCWITAG